MLLFDLALEFAELAPDAVEVFLVHRRLVDHVVRRLVPEVLVVGQITFLLAHVVQLRSGQRREVEEVQRVRIEAAVERDRLANEVRRLVRQADDVRCDGFDARLAAVVASMMMRSVVRFLRC